MAEEETQITEAELEQTEEKNPNPWNLKIGTDILVQFKDRKASMEVRRFSPSGKYVFVRGFSDFAWIATASPKILEVLSQPKPEPPPRKSWWRRVFG